MVLFNIMKSVMSENRIKRRQRIKNARSHFAQSLENKLFRQRRVERKHPEEDFDEKMFRKYRDLTEIGLKEEEG